MCLRFTDQRLGGLLKSAFS